jgi:hypothetical protein
LTVSVQLCEKVNAVLRSGDISNYTEGEIIVKWKLMAVVGAGVLLGSAVPASVALASGTGGAVKVWVTPSATGTTAKHPGKIMFTGAIGDYGTSESTNAAGKPTKKGAYKLLKLKKGTILVNGTTLSKALTSASPTGPTANETTCSFAIHVTAPVTIVRGTGAYQGITGSVTITAQFAIIGPLTKSGACTTKTSTKPLSTYSSVFGSGTVSF